MRRNRWEAIYMSEKLRRHRIPDDVLRLQDTNDRNAQPHLLGLGLHNQKVFFLKPNHQKLQTHSRCHLNYRRFRSVYEFPKRLRIWRPRLFRNWYGLHSSLWYLSEPMDQVASQLAQVLRLLEQHLHQLGEWLFDLKLLRIQVAKHSNLWHKPDSAAWEKHRLKPDITGICFEIYMVPALQPRGTRRMYLYV